MCFRRLSIACLLILYNLLFLSAGVLALPFFIGSALVLKKRRKTFFKRLGLGTNIPSLPQRPIWIHALSVGEVLASLPLVKAIRTEYPHHPLFFSVSTWSGYETAQTRLEKEAGLIFFLPYDLIWIVRKTICKVDPSIFLLIETDFWPNLLFSLKKRGVPVILINGRLSPRSFRGYRRILFFMKHVFANFSICCMQTEKDMRRMANLGVPLNKMEVTGNVKFDQEVEAVSEIDQERIKESLRISRNQKIFMAGSTHEGEEVMLLNVFVRLRNQFPELTMVIAPRDPNRAPGICRMSEKTGLCVVLKRKIEQGSNNRFDVIVVDTVGELRRLYSIADLVFIGGSLVRIGGHNPIEAAVFKKPIMFGPYMHNFEEIASLLMNADGAVVVVDEEELWKKGSMLLAESDRAKRMGESAYEVLRRHRGAVKRTQNIIKRFMGNEKDLALDREIDT